MSSYIKGVEGFGIAMIVVSSLISFGESAYNNYHNPNYTSNEANMATLMDLSYYTLKGIGTYALSSILGKLAVSIGVSIGGIVGGVWAVALGIAAAIVIYALGEGGDYIYGQIKESQFK